MAITHAFVSAVPDDPAAIAAGEVTPTHWNAGHNALTSADIPDPLSLDVLQLAQYIAIGADPTYDGAIRLTNNTFIKSDDSDGSAVSLIGMDDSPEILIDWDGYGVAFGGQVRFASTSAVVKAPGIQAFSTGTFPGFQLRDYTGGMYTTVLVRDATEVLIAKLPGLPTADPANGLSQVWNNSGVLMIGT